MLESLHPNCTAPSHFPDISVGTRVYKGLSIPEGYWKQLCSCADAHLGIGFGRENTRVYWNISLECKHAQESSVSKLMMALAFIANCSFSHSVASFRPFKEISSPPSYHKVMNKYVELFKDGIPPEIEITSTLNMTAASVMFKRVPFKVVQHAKLDTETFELTYTYAEIFWNKGEDPEIWNEGEDSKSCPNAPFVPSKHCEWLLPHHP